MRNYDDNIFRPEASVIDNRRHAAKINFSRAASRLEALRPHRQVVVLDYPCKFATNELC